MHPILKKNMSQIEQACREAGIRQLFVFGSILTDRFDEASDVDFIAEFEPMPPEGYAECYFQFCETLESILDRKVDVLTPAGIRNPVFRRELEASRQLLYNTKAA